MSDSIHDLPNLRLAAVDRPSIAKLDYALRLLGHWMRMFTIPNQSSVAEAFQEFSGQPESSRAR